MGLCYSQFTVWLGQFTRKKTGHFVSIYGIVKGEVVSSNIREGGRISMSKQEVKQKGFTIIEVVLVLAIAALIFLMVFIALPALQRNQRNTAREQQAGDIVSAVTSWQSTHRKDKITSLTEAGILPYLDDASLDGTVLTLTSFKLKFSTTKSDVSSDTAILARGMGCNADGTDLAAAQSTRQAAVLYYVETGAGSGTNQCKSS